MPSSRSCLGPLATLRGQGPGAGTLLRIACQSVDELRPVSDEAAVLVPTLSCGSFTGGEGCGENSASHLLRCAMLNPCSKTEPASTPSHVHQTYACFCLLLLAEDSGHQRPRDIFSQSPASKLNRASAHFVARANFGLDKNTLAANCFSSSSKFFLSWRMSSPSPDFCCRYSKPQASGKGDSMPLYRP